MSAHSLRVLRFWLGGRLTEIWRLGNIYTLRVTTFVDTLLDEVFCYGLECDASLEAGYVPNIGLHHAGEDRVDDLECCKSGEA